jgi:hypothetical protein
MAGKPKPDRALLVFLGGLAGVYLLTLVAYIVFTVIFDYQDREGAAAMGVAFFFAPIGGLICAVAAAVWAARRKA